MNATKKILGIFGNVAFFGQERANLQVFKLLQDVGYEVVLAVNQQGFHWHLQPEVEARQLRYRKMVFSWNFRKTLKWKHIKGYLVNIPQSNWQLHNIIKQEKPDVLHVCNDTHVMSLLPVLIFNRTKLIYRLGDQPSSHLSLFHKFLWKRLIIPRVDHFVCISRFISQKIQELGCDEAKITIIYNFPPKRVAPMQPLPVERSPDHFTFCYIGQLSKDKGIDILMKAFLELCKNHHNCRLLIAGDLKHNQEMTSRLEKMVQSSNFSQQITFLGKIDNIDDLLQKSDINIIPSVYEEPLSNVIVEAKANATASIVFPSGGLPELVEHEKNGYISKGKDEASLLSAMEYYVNNKSLAKIHGKNAHESLKDNDIDFESFKNKWLEVYG